MKKGSHVVDIALYLFALGLLIGSIALGYALFHQEEEGEAQIIVKEVYFGLKKIEGTRSEVEIFIFISNIGDDDIDTLRIRVFTIETRSNLAKDDAEVILTDIPKMRSAEGKLLVRIPNRDIYRVEILIFRDGRLDIRGHGTIDLTGVGMTAEYKTQSGGGRSESNDSPLSLSPAKGDASSAFCIFALFLIGGVLILVVIIIAVRKSSGNKDRTMWNAGDEEDRNVPAKDINSRDKEQKEEIPKEEITGEGENEDMQELLGNLGSPEGDEDRPDKDNVDNEE